VRLTQELLGIPFKVQLIRQRVARRLLDRILAGLERNRG
jgi:hypothetical protein